MPESFIPVWMSVGEAENFRSTLHELDDSEAGLPERELSLIEGALERERPRTYAEMDAEQKAAASPSPQAEPQGDVVEKLAEFLSPYVGEALEGVCKEAPHVLDPYRDQARQLLTQLDLAPRSALALEVKERLEEARGHLEKIRDLDEQTSDGSLGSLARRALAALDTPAPSEPEGG